MDATSSARKALDPGTRDAGERDEALARSASPEAVPAPLARVPASPTSPQQAAAPQPATPPGKPTRKGKGRAIVAAILAAGLAGGGYYGWGWWTVGRFQETTDNAFLQADKVTVAPRIAGVVATVAVGDNQPVHAGDVVATIDDRDARIQVDGARADLAKAQAQLEGYKAAVVQQLATVASNQADIANAEPASPSRRRRPSATPTS